MSLITDAIIPLFPHIHDRLLLIIQMTLKNGNSVVLSGKGEH